MSASCTCDVRFESECGLYAYVKLLFGISLLLLSWFTRGIHHVPVRPRERERSDFPITFFELGRFRFQSEMLLSLDCRVTNLKTTPLLNRALSITRNITTMPAITPTARRMSFPVAYQRPSNVP